MPSPSAHLFFGPHFFLPFILKIPHWPLSGAVGYKWGDARPLTLPSPTWPKAGVQAPALGPASGALQPEVLPAVFSQFGDGATLGALCPALASCIAWSPPHARTVHPGSCGPGYRSLQELVPLPGQWIKRPASQVFKHRFKVGFTTPLCCRLGSVSSWLDGSCCIKVVLCFLPEKG